jgi:hypothetical protein
MSFFTVHLFRLHVDSIIFAIIFFSTFSSYNLHWYFSREVYEINSFIEERSTWNQKNKSTVLIGFALSSIILFFLLLINSRYIIYFVPAAVAAFLYTAPKIPIDFLKRLEGKAWAKTTYLTATWLYVTCLLPFLITGSTLNKTIINYLLINFLYLYLICLLFDYRDRKKEEVNVILIDNKKYFKTIYWSLTSVLLILIMYNFKINEGFLNAGYICGLFILTLGFKKSIAHPTDKWYYFVLDGLMMLPGLVNFLP